MKKIILTIAILIGYSFGVQANIINTGNNPVFTRDFIIEAKKGNIEGVSVVFVSGLNDAVGTTLEDVWSYGGLKTNITNAATLEISSDNQGDITNGVGARSVIVYGLNENWQSTSAIYNLYGTNKNQSVTNKFIRVNSMSVYTSGSYALTSVGRCNSGDMFYSI